MTVVDIDVMVTIFLYLILSKPLSYHCLRFQILSLNLISVTDNNLIVLDM